MPEIASGVSVVAVPPLAPPTVVTPPTPPTTVTVLPVPGPPGPPGAGAGGGLVHLQTSPSASWAIGHPFGRLPSVVLYVAGELVDADVSATDTDVYVTFPAPTAGVAVLV